MSRKTRKLIWSAPLVTVLAVAGVLAMFVAQGTGSVFANPLPEAPSNLTVTPATGNDGKDGRTMLVLNWDPVTDATGYRVDRSEGGGVWETIPDATEDDPVSQTSFEDDTLKAGETMHYRVFAVNQHGIGRASAPASDTTSARGMPGPAMNLRAMGTDYTEITLSWEEPDDTGGVDITGYEIQRHVEGDGKNWAHVAIEVDGTSYEHTVHASTDDWIYRVRALNLTPVPVAVITQDSTANDAHAGKWTRVTGNSKPASNPSPVTGLTAVNTGTNGGGITLYWYAPVNNGGVAISHYIVQARLTGNSANVDWKDLPDVDETTELGNISATETLNADPALPATPSYTIRIVDPNDASVSQAVFVGATQIYNHDDDAGTPDVTAMWQFQVYTETTEPGPNVNQSDDDGDVRRSAASGTATSTAEARPNTGDALAEPTLVASFGTVADDNATVAGVAREGEIALCIAPSATDLVPSYRIDASDDGGINWKPLRQDTRGTVFGECGDNSRPYTDDGLGDDASRTYRAFAIGGPSSALTTGGTTASDTPGKVAGLSVTIPDLNTIEATWTALTGDETGGQPIVEYRLQYTQDDGDDISETSDWTTATDPILKTTDADGMETWTLETENTLEENENYYARIIAVNRFGPDPTDALRPLDDDSDGAESTALEAAEVVPFSTGEAAPPNEPEGLTSERATNRTGELLRGVDLRWNKPSDGPTVGSYDIERKINDGEWAAPTKDSTGWRATLTLFTDPRPYVSGETLAYQVRAKNDDGESDWVMVYYPHDPASDHTHELTKPANVEAMSDAAGELTLTWESGDNADSYLLIAVNTADTSDYKIASVSDGTAQMGTVTGLTSGVDYLGIVIALKGTGTDRTFEYGVSGTQAVQ